ncbi:glycosyltransferase, partial [Pseudomonas aeruginosa]
GATGDVVEGVVILYRVGDETALAEGLTHLAALDPRQREACARLMLERQETRISDAAVRREFWRLPTIAG